MTLRFMHELSHLFALLVGTRRKYVDPSKAVEILKESFSPDTSSADNQQVIIFTCAVDSFSALEVSML